ncbi:Hpt domain-containing protein [Arthrobacter subterraneus]|uniref:Hpt domain-containing protein n=1 Tax=Arthrobacter subterraneus TaxID=335973 RepID=UPI0037F1D68E
MAASKRPPLVTWSVLRRLEDEFDDPAPARSFVRDFIAYWDDRYLRLVHTVEGGDAAASLDALLSVRITATMIGATRLARLTADLESSLKRGDLGAVAEALPEMQDCAAATIRELTRKYVNTER